MKDEIRLLFFKDIKVDLDNEKLKYVAVKNDDNTYYINDATNSLLGMYSALSNYFCYDYDELSIYNQMRYERNYIELKRVNDNIYSKCEKTYKRTMESLT